MTPDDADDLTADELLAEQLVDEALRTMAIPAFLLPTIRATLIAELLVTPAGQRMLRRVKADPKVAGSGDVPTGDPLAATAGPPATKKKKGGNRP